jgi:hypothetical protein
MTDYVINPQIEVKFFGNIETFTIPAPGELLTPKLAMDFSITKDLDEEPNEATLIISGLSKGTRGKIITAADQSCPVEIRLTPYNSTNLTLAFKGEIDYATNRQTQPGWETEIYMLGQKLSHRSFYVDKKTFAEGTYVDDILDFFIDTIGLPRGKIENIQDLPDRQIGTKILTAESHTGPAFYLLRKRALDEGMFAYILDGTINMTNIFDPQDITAFSITADMLRMSPEVTSRVDERDIEIRGIYEAVTQNPLAKQRIRKPKNKWERKVKSIKRTGQNDYEEYEAVDALVDGANFEIFCQPGLNPDNIVSCDAEDFENRLFRVTQIEHYGNSDDFSDWNTLVETDEYNVSEGFEAEL